MLLRRRAYMVNTGGPELQGKEVKSLVAEERQRQGYRQEQRALEPLVGHDILLLPLLQPRHTATATSQEKKEAGKNITQI